MTNFSVDNFTRANTVSPSWGSSVTGEAWTRPFGSATVYSVTSNEGVINNTPGTWDHFLLGTTTVSTTLDVVVRGIVDNAASMFGVLIRLSSNGLTGYKVMYDGAGHLIMYYDSPGTGLVQIGTTAAFTVTVSSSYYVRGQINGTTLMGKIWPWGTTEPASWLLSSSVGVNTITTGGYGILGNANNNLRFDNFIASNGAAVTNSAQTVTETIPVIESVSTQTVGSSQTVTETTAVSEQVVTMLFSVPMSGTVGGVRLIINDVWYPTIRQESISIARTANDPIPTFTFLLQDDPSQIPLSELQEVIFLDAGQVPNPTHNLLQNPTITPYGSNWTAQTATGGTITQINPGVILAMSNATGTVQLSQQTQPSFVTPGQFYCLSVVASTSTTFTNCSAYLTLSFLDAKLNSLVSQTALITANLSATSFNVQLQAPNAAVYMVAAIGMSQSSGTNAGSVVFQSIQLEPMSFAGGKVQQTYPSSFCARGQWQCTPMPDGTAVRQYRLFGGYITKAVAGKYIGNNRQWTVTVSGYAWLIQKQQLNDTFTAKTDNFIINNLITKYFPNQFSTSQVATGATLDAFGYTWNGTLRDAFDFLAANSNFYYYIDPYRVIFYQPPGYNQLAFQLSDQPDGVQSFPYYAYTFDTDGTQLGNATLVTGATGISAIEYDAQSIGHYNLKTNGQGTFWRTVNDTTITTTNAARMRAIAENTQYNYARQIAHLSTQQMMIPGYSVIFSSASDQVFEQSFLIQKSTLILQGFISQGIPQYECQCDVGAWNPDLVNITVRMLRKQQVSTNSIGTPVIGLMATEQMTFIDQVNITVVHGSPATYSMGIYGTSVYATSVPGVPVTQYGVGSYGDLAHGYQ